MGENMEPIIPDRRENGRGDRVGSSPAAICRAISRRWI
jgi:hypothetical protein